MNSRTGMRVTQTQRLALTSSLRTALRVLKMDAAGLTRYLEEQAAELPALTLRPALPTLGDWLPRWSGTRFSAQPDPDQIAAAPEPSLMAHVIQALPTLVPAGPQRRIALALADALEPSGWLGQDLAAIAQTLTVSQSEVENVLLQLQKIDPAGLFARDLAECLQLQAKDLGVLDPTMKVMLSNLGLVASSDWGALAALAHVLPEDIRSTFATLRSFNPKPGASFSSVASPLREPDLLVHRSEAGWTVELNRSSLPLLSIDEAGEGAAQAKAVMKLVDQRNVTLLLVGRAVLEHQRPALEAGTEAFAPLTMQMIADELSLHKSTISRVVAGVAIDTPKGTWWLRSLFSADMGAGLGAAALRARLSRLIAEEDKSAPLSDDALAAQLSTGGTVVARRTVAKYRSGLKIAPANRRRKSRKR
ncbi:RNA polymerase factor sigma-54 [Thioclava sp. FR2]|uniref:RNA polymerase factor sigma-54 n=1 Tax=Thioclava sp. FR2 TaxID=3445780 RepID=UPI003EB703ED